MLLGSSSFARLRRRGSRRHLEPAVDIVSKWWPGFHQREMLAAISRRGDVRPALHGAEMQDRVFMARKCKTRFHLLTMSFGVQTVHLSQNHASYVAIVIPVQQTFST
jgi:hypothetical protein